MGNLARVVDVMQLFGEPMRVRLAALLSERELTVAELTVITEAAQSRVSTHLARLRDAGVLRDRREGTSTFYRLQEGMPEEVRRVWEAVVVGIEDGVLEGDRKRCEELLAARRDGKGWPELVAGQMERHYSPGRTWESLARGLLGLIRLGDVLDAGAGDGTVAELVAPRAKSVTCVDRSEKMIDAARRRLASVKNARCLVGDVENLALADASFDHALLLHVLTMTPRPQRAIGEAARVLRPGGGVTVITLDAHDHGDVTAAYGDVHPGFKPASLRRMLDRAGLTVEQCEVAARERRQPHFQAVIAFATKGER